MTKTKKILSIVLSLLMVLSCFSGMSLTAFAGEAPPYADLKNTTTAITFDNKQWYLIDYDSTTVTLLSKECVGASAFNSIPSNTYSGSTVETYVNNWYTSNISADAKAAVDGSGMFLLTKDQANELSSDVRKCDRADGAEDNIWWLCSTGRDGRHTAIVYGGSGYVDGTGYDVQASLGVRPALKLDLSKVEFNSKTKTFAVYTPGAYADYLPAEADDADALAAKVVKFNGHDWYLIEDNSTSETEGTVTLFAKECVGASKFGTNNTYSGSTVETYVNNWYTSNISADAKAAVDGNGMFLLTSDQASALSSDVRKCSEASGAQYNYWWLCTPFSYYLEVACVDGDYGVVRDGVDDGTDVEDTLGVRPALKLDLSKVEFNSETKTFAVPHIHDGITFTAWTSTNSLPTDGGNYYLTNDVLLENTWYVPNAEVNLCLDGHSIGCAEGMSIQPICVDGEGTTLKLYDKDDNSGTITGALSTAGGVDVRNGGTFHMYGGTVTGNTSTDHGGGVRVRNNATFYLYGGTIENNKTQNTGGYGGGVHVESNSTFNMSGGSVKNNTAFSSAGVFIGTNCTFNMSGGSITGNATTGGEGGGVLFTDDGTATFKLSGDVTISDNITKIDIEEIDVHETYPSNMVIPDSVTIEVVDALTGEGKIYVQIGTSRVFTNSTGSVKAKDYIDKFVSDSRMYRIKTEGDELKIEAPYLIVGGTFVYDDNAADVFGDGKVKFTPANETTTYATLTLNGYQYDGTADENSEGIIYLDSAQLRIVLKGENIVKATNPGIMINRQLDTVISSENGGSLEVVSEQGDAIYANGALTVESGTISATGANRGIAANGINFNGGKIVATGTGERGYGIYCEKLPWLPDNSVSINSGITSLIASGTLGAVYGDVANALEGLGWSNITGTEGLEAIAVTAEARSLEYKKVAFVSHTHSFTYSASGATITATCANADGGCMLTDNKATLTIAAPDNLTYDKSAKAAVITDANGIQGAAKVQYQTKNGSTYGEATETAPTNAGTYKASITVGGATASVEYTIAKAEPTYTAPTGLTATYGQTLANVTLPDGWAWANTGTSVGIVGTRTFKAIFTPNDTANYNVVYNIDVTVTVGKANPTYTVPTGLEATYGDTLSSVTLPTGWSWVNGSQNVGNADTKTFKATYTPTDTTNYNVVNNVDVTVTVNKADINPTVSITGWTYGETANTPSVTGNNGDGHVKYTYAVKGSDEFSETVPTDANTYTVKATIAATTNYNGATATADFTIAKADPTYTVPTGLYATYGDTLADVTLPIGWAWADDTTSVGNAGTKTFKANYTPADTTNYNVVENVDVTVKVNPADITPTVTLEGWTYGQEPNAPSVSGNVGDGTVTYTYATKGSDNFSETVPTNAGNYTVKATIAATTNYNGATATADFTITKADPTYTVPTGLYATYGDTLADVTLPTGWAWADDTTSVGNAGAKTFKANFTPSDTANYNTVNNVDVTVTVAKADPSYTAPSGLAATYGDTLADVELPDGWSWADDSTSVGNVGTNCFNATFTPEDTDNYNVLENISVKVDVEPADSTAAEVSANDRIYNTEEEALVTVDGEAVGGTMLYALGEDGETAPEEGWSEEIPAATDADTYFVWYMVKGDENHNSTEPVCVEVTINQTGWYEIDGEWYFYDDDGTLHTGWLKSPGCGKWFYMDEETGAMTTGWVKSPASGQWFYLKPWGDMATGWWNIDGVWYYFKDSGAMTTGWRNIDGKWYFFNSSGAMQTGWVKDAGKWYYLNTDGSMKTGWVKDGGNWYYLDTDGAMLANTSKKINGKTYKFNSSGVCTNP